MGFDEPHPSSERSSPIRLRTLGHARYKSRSYIQWTQRVVVFGLDLFCFFDSYTNPHAIKSQTTPIVTSPKCQLQRHHILRSCEIYICSRRSKTAVSRSRWPRGLRRGSAVARMLGLRARIPLGAWKSVSCECCVLSGRGLCVGLITHPEVSCWVWYAWLWWQNLDSEEDLAH
jgi:hypothetical protein